MVFHFPWDGNGASERASWLSSNYTWFCQETTDAFSGFKFKPKAEIHSQISITALVNSCAIAGTGSQKV
jgi:hypothetical protein